MCRVSAQVAGSDLDALHLSSVKWLLMRLGSTQKTGLALGTGNSAANQVGQPQTSHISDTYIHPLHNQKDTK